MRLPLARLKKRAEFLRVAQGRRWAMPGLVLQVRQRTGADGGAARVGFTVSRKVGIAVVRNRARRRLRAAAAAVLPDAGRPDHDYVLVGRAGTLTREFDDLVRDLKTALERVHRAELKPRRDGKTRA